MKSLKLTALALFLASGAVMADNVTVYDRAPSVEELQRQLMGGAAPAPVTTQKPAARTRAIVFGEPEAPVPAPAAAPAAPAAAYTPPAPAAAYQAAPSAVAVSSNAIAFPINFRVNSADILPESVPYLESIAGLLMKDPGMRLVVEGHTDASGSASKNLTLSRERAFSVMNYLVDQYRIDPLRLVPVGKGFSEPLGGLEPSNPKNRRVQFRVMG